MKNLTISPSCLSTSVTTHCFSISIKVLIVADETACSNFLPPLLISYVSPALCTPVHWPLTPQNIIFFLAMAFAHFWNTLSQLPNSPHLLSSYSVVRFQSSVPTTSWVLPEWLHTSHYIITRSYNAVYRHFTPVFLITPLKLPLVKSSTTFKLSTVESWCSTSWTESFLY